jgi:hypothetical protein
MHSASQLLFLLCSLSFSYSSRSHRSLPTASSLFTSNCSSFSFSLYFRLNGCFRAGFQWNTFGFSALHRSHRSKPTVSLLSFPTVALSHSRFHFRLNGRLSTEYIDFSALSPFPSLSRSPPTFLVHQPRDNFSWPLTQRHSREQLSSDFHLLVLVRFLLFLVH